jgi:hypothetical protein
VHPLSRLGIAAERLRSPSVSAPHRESLARHTGPGLLTYLIVPKVPKGPHLVDECTHSGDTHRATRRPRAVHMPSHRTVLAIRCSASMRMAARLSL